MAGMQGVRRHGTAPPDPANPAASGRQAEA